MAEQLRGEYSPYYSKSEICGGVVTVSFSNNMSPQTFQTALENINHLKYPGMLKKEEGYGHVQRTCLTIVCVFCEAPLAEQNRAECLF
jgi:hypothetical protein